MCHKVKSSRSATRTALRRVAVGANSLAPNLRRSIVRARVLEQPGSVSRQAGLGRATRRLLTGGRAQTGKGRRAGSPARAGTASQTPASACTCTGTWGELECEDAARGAALQATAARPRSRLTARCHLCMTGNVGKTGNARSRNATHAQPSGRPRSSASATKRPSISCFQPCSHGGTWGRVRTRVMAAAGEALPGVACSGIADGAPRTLLSSSMSSPRSTKRSAPAAGV